jgi:hypothetical protein
MEILLIASQVARITGVSHWHLQSIGFFSVFFFFLHNYRIPSVLTSTTSPPSNEINGTVYTGFDIDIFLTSPKRSPP